MLAADFVVAPGGDDWNPGTLDQPFQTIRRALDAASAGDTITLRNGVYEGGINIDVNHLTIRSMPGEWAVIESPLTEWTDGHANSVIRYNYDIQGGRLENLEITGGYWYGVMMWDWWDSNWDSGSTHVGASGVTIEGCKIHDTGVDAVKITPGANDISILDCEIFNTGRRSSTSADGIDNNNGDRMIARGNYLHDIAGVGILTSGGTVDSLIDANLVRDTKGAGIVVGFYSEAEWMEPGSNPNYYTSINTIARNNIIVNAGHAGVGVYSSLNPLVANNTIINAASEAQAPLQFGGVDIWISDNDPSHHVASVNPVVLNNLITTATDNDTRMVDIRYASINGGLTLDHNLYHGTSVRGTLFIDRNLTGEGTPEKTFSQWKATYGHDGNSLLADPQLGADWHLLAGSPAIGQAISLADVTQDHDGNPRAGASIDIGADEFNAGGNLTTPPAPFGAPSIEIASRGYHNDESQSIVVKIVRHGQTSDTVGVQFATLDGSAKAGLDYAAVAGSLTFLPGETEKLVSVALLGDSLPEGDEHFLFTLSNPTTDGSYPVRLGHQSTASMTVDDAQTPITLNYRTLWVSNAGSDVLGDGSEANPWKSLQHAADQVGPGDYVIVKPGQYWGFQVTTDGKPDARITFHAMPGVLIDAPNPENQLDGINLEGADHVTIEGFEVNDMPRAGLRSVLNTGAILRGNKADHNGYWGILTGWSYDLLVENNVISRSVREHGIYISNSSDDGIIRNNVVWGNNDSGIQFNADGYLEGDGVHSRNIIEGNVLYENGKGGGATINLDGFQDGIVRNNLLYNNHATGIVLYVGYAAESSTNNLVANNTVVMAADSRWALLMTDGSSGNIIIDNILLTKNPNRGSMTVELNSLPGLSDHNIVQDSFQLDGSNSGFAQWQAFSGGMDSHSIVVGQAGVLSLLNDLFVNPSSNDYHLKAGSPAIDVGDPTGAPSFDIYQHARPVGPGVDIGAFEAGSFNPSVQFEWGDTIGYEFIGMAEVAITRTGDTEGTLVVDVISTNGSATAGQDYQALNTQVVFLPGETRKTLQVFLMDDQAIEGMETVQLNLMVGGQSISQAVLHLVSDDAWRPGRFEFDASSITFDETAGVATIVVRRQDGGNGPASVDYSTNLFVRPRQATWIKRHTDLLYPTDNDLPATAGDDYIAQQGTLAFADGETEKTITIAIVDDTWHESDEAFVLKLSDPTNGATLGSRSQTKVRIHSDDAKLPGTFVWDAPTYTVTEGTPTVNVTVKRINGGNVESSVRLYHTGAGNASTLGSAWWPSDYGSLPEILTFAPGELVKTLSIPIIDDSSTEIDEAFSIQLYSPSNDALVGASATTLVTIQDNESTFYFSAGNGGYSFSAAEGGGFLPVTVVRQGARTTAASVRIKTGEWGSAIAGVDFTAIDVTLQFAPGEASKVIQIPLVNDTIVEPTETFPVSMSDVMGASQGSWSWSCSILDDDVAAGPVALSLGAATYSVSEDGGSLNVLVNRTGDASTTVSVQYRTLDGAGGVPSNQTAYAGADYTSTSGILTFGPGETSKMISITITNDSSVEQNECFTIELRNPAGGATLGAISKAVATIVEDDSSIEFATSNYLVNESAGFVSITLVRKGNTAGTSSIDLNISDGTAANGLDYHKPADKKVTFLPGESTKTVQVALVDDVLAEIDEWFYLALSNATGSKLGSSLWGNVKIKDND